MTVTADRHAKSIENRITTVEYVVVRLLAEMMRVPRVIARGRTSRMSFSCLPSSSAMLISAA